VGKSSKDKHVEVKMESQILLVDDDPGMIQLMGGVLSGIGHLRFATSGGAALQQARDVPPDLILLDAEMPGMSGFQVCEAMQADPALRDIPVIFVTGHSGAEFELKGFEIGAVDFIAKPISEPLLLARVKTQLRIKHLTDELRRIGTIDALTETLNRRSFDQALAREWRRGRRVSDPVSLLMIDVDHFKLFNDHYGHPAGDACLRSVAQALRGASMRPADVVARYGGDEFSLLLPQTPRDGAEHMAHRVLDAIERLAIPHETSPCARHITVSVGIGIFDQDSLCWIEASSTPHMATMLNRTVSDLVQSADKALYAAKRAGRAQAWRLDIDDVDTNAKACEIAPGSRMARSRTGA
jgi:diguanylate cyclase (GGDEF)-like protein